MSKILAVMGSSSDAVITEDGLKFLEQLGVTYSMRVASAHRTPAHLEEILKRFEQDGGKIIICIAGMSAHLAGVVASLTLKPVLAVPVARAETAGFDSLLSMSQMPKGVPVSTFGFGKSGFANACLQAAQVLALSDVGLASAIKSQRAAAAEQVIMDDAKTRRDFRG